MKLLFQNSKNKQFTTLDVDPQATVESVRDELKSKHGFPDGVYSFIYKGKILRNPGPFSSLEENTKVIVYVKADAPKPPPEAEPQQTPPPEISHIQRPQIQRPPPQQRVRDDQILDLITPILRSAISTNLVEKVYQEENDFYNHPKEIYEISQILDESVYGLISEFLIRHFETTMRSFDLTQERILSIVGNNLPMIFRVLNDFDASFMELSDEQKTVFERLKNLKYDPKVTLDTFIACEYNEERTTECLRQMH